MVLNRVALLTAAALAATVSTSGVLAATSTVTFETATIGPNFTGPVQEAGIQYQLESGGLYINALGNPGNDLEGGIDAGGGTVRFRATTPNGLFTFQGLDYAAYNSLGAGSQSLTVRGLVNGNEVASDVFTLANVADAANGAFANWTGFVALNLSGRNINGLIIDLAAGASADFRFTQAIDNVRFGSPVVAVEGVDAVPELASWVMMVAGFAATGIALRGRQTLKGASTM